ncbi:serine/threonine-protein kinase Nek4-like [Mya arenaria]|uniref:serine/threonine-protein kinase Nek4-like n=1 Tax=Mya arenaria TaxID=6604 RepID=UPI0022E1810A|nr:serine/threonine-protein kinase Nek4-like [Mya arenaria]
MDNSLDLKYEKLLGEGSYGKVFLVKQEDGQQFAVKEIDLEKCDEAGRDQANGEAHLLSRLKQENILTYVESVVCDDCLYIVTEFCAGGDMEDYLQRIKKSGMSVPEALVSDWILQIGGALKYLHDQKILHRDMKTKNIFLKEDLTVKLGDLGIAKVLDLNQTKADTFIGTPSYMSPELFSGKSYNHKTDIWGLGCCVYEMMTLQRAFQGRALWTLIREIKNGKVLETPDTYSLEIRMLVQQMMEQQPDDRPSAKDIVQNDLLLYHRGSATTMVRSMPQPNQESEKKKSGTGTGSGSLRNALKQMNQSKEDKYRNSIAHVCEKINTLRMTQQGTSSGTMIEYDTFVYKKDDSDSDSDLEAPGTVLDASLLKQFTEQLDTFVMKETLTPVSERGNITEGTITNKQQVLNGDKEIDDDNDDEDDDNDETSQTLLRQYSQTLDEEDDNEEEEVEERENKSMSKVIQGHGQCSWLGHIDSDEEEDQFNEQTLKNVSKYKYKGLKDTFALRPDKRWNRQRSDPTDWFSPQKVSEGHDLDDSDSAHSSPVRSKSDTKHDITPKSVQRTKPVSLSSTGTLSGTRQRTDDPRLMQTLDGTSKSRTAKVPICDRIEQSTKDSSKKRIAFKGDKRHKSPKKAFDVPVNDNNEEPEFNVGDVIAHLKDNMSPYSSVDTHSETIRSQGSDDVFENQEPSQGKGKKKKESFLKKQSEAKRKGSDVSASVDHTSSSTDVKLFTRAQHAKFSKSYSEDSTLNGQNGHQAMQDVLSQVRAGCSDSVRTEHILHVQHELSEGMGYDNLRHVLGIMDLVSDENDLQVHLEHVLGPSLYNKYKTHLQVLRTLEGKTHRKNLTGR